MFDLLVPSETDMATALKNGRFFDGDSISGAKATRAVVAFG